MVLNIAAEWVKPVVLNLTPYDVTIYQIDKLDDIPSVPGIYVFARKHGNSISPMYVGQAKELKNRIKGQLNNLALMRSIEKSPKGQRILLYCAVHTKPGQNITKALAIIENSIIDHALSEGYDLFNKQGKSRPRHEINFSGNRDSEKIAPRKIYVRSKP